MCSVTTYLRCGGVVNKQIKKGLLLSLSVNFLNWWPKWGGDVGCHSSIFLYFRWSRLPHFGFICTFLLNCHGRNCFFAPWEVKFIQPSADAYRQEWYDSFVAKDHNIRQKFITRKSAHGWSGARFAKYLTTVLRLSDDNAKVTIGLRRTYILRKILRTMQGTIYFHNRKIVGDSVNILAYDIPNRNLGKSLS